MSKTGFFISTVTAVAVVAVLAGRAFFFFTKDFRAKMQPVAVAAAAAEPEEYTAKNNEQPKAIAAQLGAPPLACCGLRRFASSDRRLLPMRPGISVSDLVRLNAETYPGLKGTSRLQAGTVLQLPTAAEAARTRAAEAAATDWSVKNVPLFKDDHMANMAEQVLLEEEDKEPAVESREDRQDHGTTSIVMTEDEVEKEQSPLASGPCPEPAAAEPSEKTGDDTDFLEEEDLRIDQETGAHLPPVVTFLLLHF